MPDMPKPGTLALVFFFAEFFVGLRALASRSPPVQPTPHGFYCFVSGLFLPFFLDLTNRHVVFFLFSPLFSSMQRDRFVSMRITVWFASLVSVYFQVFL